MRKEAPIAPEIPRAVLEAELRALPESRWLVEAGRFRACYARAAEVPSLLDEIARLRELTFRAAGEGTGKPADRDAFDAHYLHLFLWDADAGAIAGAYRLGLADEILARHGTRGLYTSTLFGYGAGLLAQLDPGIELGRSFVRAEYQRSFAPLLLLWRGIGAFVAREPRYAVLFGAVSISNRYSAASRELIVEQLLAGCDIDELSAKVARIEPDGKGLPVLLRHYLRLGGRLLAFSVDHDFADVLDGLLVVDLRESDPSLLARYMGEAGSRSFLAYHRGRSPNCDDRGRSPNCDDRGRSPPPAPGRSSNSRFSRAAPRARAAR